MTKTWLALAVVLGVRAASAQEGAAQELITEEAWLRGLAADHPALVALRAEVGDAEASAVRARTLNNPEIALEVESPRELSTQTTWSLAWSPPLDGRRGLRVKAAEARLDGARLDLGAAELRFRIEAREVYADWSVSHRRRELLAAQLDVVARIAAHVRARANAGEASGLSARRVELAVGGERAELARAESMLARAHAVARALYPQLSTAARPILSSLPVATNGVDPNLSPDVQARLQAVREAEIDAVEARRFITAPSFAVGWQRVEESGLHWSGPVYGVAWTIPLFDRRDGDRLATAERLDGARAELEISNRRASAGAVGAQAAYALLRDAALTAAASLEDADRLIESATAAYDHGETDTTDLLETLRAVLHARLTALDLHADALAAHRALELAAGRPLLPAEGDHR